MGLLEDLGNLIGGSPQEHEQARQQGLGGVVSSIPGNVAAATKLAGTFGSIGNVGSNVGMVTGYDPLAGTEQSNSMRGFGIAALFGMSGVVSAMGVVAGGSRMRRALDLALEDRAKASAVLSLLPDADSFPIADRIATLVQKNDSIVPHGSTESVLAGVNQPATSWDMESVFGQFRYTDTAGFLRQLAGDGTGANSVASTILRRGPQPISTPELPVQKVDFWGPDIFPASRTPAPLPDPQIAYVNGFVAGLGDKLVTTPHWSGLTQTLPGDQLQIAKQHVAAFELSRFASSVAKDANYPSTKPFLAGKRFKVAKRAWEDLRSGKKLKPELEAELADAITAHATATWWNDSPELTGSAKAAIRFINIDPAEDASVGIEYLDFDAVPLERLTKQEAQSRIAMMFQLDPIAMVPMMSDNITRFTKKFVDNDTIAYWSSWYPVARAATEAAAADVGMDIHRFIVLTSIMSPSQPWEENVEKAKVFARRWQEMKTTGGDLRTLWTGTLTKGKNLGGDGLLLPYLTAQLADLVMNADDPWVYFVDGLPTSTNALTVAEMHSRFMAGEKADDVLKLRFNASDKQLKTPSFAAAIANSSREELRQQAAWMAKIMRDGLFNDVGSDDVLEAMRLRVPVVVDRQATKVAWGFSLEPGNELSNQPGMYDSLAQAYRNAAIEIGPVWVGQEKRFLLPEELQAVTWVQYRMLGHVRFSTAELPPGYPVPRSMNTPGNPARTNVEWRPGEIAPTAGTDVAGYIEGAGPTLITDRSLLDIVTGAVDRLPFLGVDAVDYATDTSRYWNDPDTWFPAPSPVMAENAKRANWRNVGVHVAPDGSMKLLTDEWGPRLNGALMARSPVLGKIELDDGQELQALTPHEPVLIEDVPGVYGKLQESSRSTTNPMMLSSIGATYYPEGAPPVWLEAGDHLLVSTEAAKDGKAGFGVAAMKQFEAELRAQGINASVQILPGFNGWTDPPLVRAEQGDLAHITSAENAQKIRLEGFKMTPEGEINGNIAARQWGDGIYVGRYGYPFMEQMANEWQSVNGDATPTIMSVEINPKAKIFKLFDTKILDESGRFYSKDPKVWEAEGLRFPTADENPHNTEDMRRILMDSGFDGIDTYDEVVVWDPANVQPKREWVPDESRTGAVFSFQSNDDLIRAAEYLQKVGTGDAPTSPRTVASATRQLSRARKESFDIAYDELWAPSFEDSAATRAAAIDMLKLGKKGGPYVVPFEDAGGTRSPSADHKRAAGVMLRAIRDVPPEQLDLYRGIALDSPHPMLDLKPGSVIDIPLMATSPDIESAAEYIYNGSGDTSVMVRVKGPTKAVPGTSMTEMYTGADGATTEVPYEYITGGRFRVEDISIEPGDGGPVKTYVDITLRQVDVFDPESKSKSVKRVAGTIDTGEPNGKRIFKEMALDARAYVSGDVSAPVGWQPLMEHHFKDPQGRELVVLNTEGDQWSSNTRKVWAHPELSQFVTPTRTSALRPGGPLHTIEPWAKIQSDDLVRVIERPATAPADQMAEWRNPLERYAIQKRTDPNGKWGKEQKVSSMLVGYDDQGIAHVAFDADALQGVAPERTYRVSIGEEPEFDTKRSRALGRPVVKLKKDSKGKMVQTWHRTVVLDVPRNAEGKADAVYGRKVVELLKRIGFTEMPTTKTWNKADFA